MVHTVEVVFLEDKGSYTRGIKIYPISVYGSTTTTDQQIELNQNNSTNLRTVFTIGVSLDVVGVSVIIYYGLVQVNN